MLIHIFQMYPQMNENMMSPPNYQLHENDQNDEAIPVCVAVRIKPKKENESRSLILNTRHGNNELSIVGPDIPQEKFKFEFLLGENESQNDVYKKVLAQYFPVILDGFDLFVIMYGGSGCGKSYTLLGPQSERTDSELGIIPRFVNQVFENFNQHVMKVHVSSFEVTNDIIRDLVSETERGKF